MGKMFLRFVGYYAMNSIVTLILIFLYGIIDVAAGYLILVMPISAGIATLILLLIKYKFEEINKFLFALLVPIVNILGMILLFIYLFSLS